MPRSPRCHGQLALCGPLSLMEAARAAWQRSSRPIAGLRFETFGNSGEHAAEPFWVELPRHGLRFEVPAGRNLLNMLEEHGVQALSDCRRGECGLCAMAIVELKGAVDHRDVLFSAEHKQANARLCACVSRVCGGAWCWTRPSAPIDRRVVGSRYTTCRSRPSQ